MKNSRKATKNPGGPERDNAPQPKVAPEDAPDGTPEDVTSEAVSGVAAGAVSGAVAHSAASDATKTGAAAPAPAAGAVAHGATAKAPRLTPRQAAFVQEYLVDLNATQAALRAGYSASTAHSQGAAFLKKPQISTAVREALNRRSARVELSQDAVIEELRRIAFGDLRDIAEWGADGVQFKNSNDLTAEQAATVAEISESVTSTGGSKRIKRHDKVKALELLGRHMGMWNDKLNVTGGAELAAAIEEGRKRLERG